jgi:hypothetical protein
MIKHFICISIVACAAGSAFSQVNSSQNPQTYPGNYNNNNNPPGYNYNNTQPGYNPNNGQPAYNNQPGYNNNQPVAGGVMFSNNLGQTFSANQLAAQLQTLRNVVDQTLPMLTAFNENASNSAGGGKSTVGGALSGIVSDVLHRNQNNQNSSSTYTGQGSSTASNLLSVLHGLLNNNPNGATGTTPNPQDLVTLQNDLQPVVSVLQRLNVNANPNPMTTPNQYGTTPQPYPNNGLTPTGR